MSHTVTIKTQVRDRHAVDAACRRQRLDAPALGTHSLFGQQVDGYGVKLRGWHYPVVCKLASGELAYDNFGGHWGEQQELDGFLQAYAVEKAKLEARKKGHTASERVESDGSIVLTINT
jgi:hypothetical protein